MSVNRLRNRQRSQMRHMDGADSLRPGNRVISANQGKQ